jgi:hypothetical protein
MDEANSTTRARVITAKYVNLCQKLKPFFPADKDIFPDLTTYDIVDVLFYFSLLFVCAADDYKGNLKSLLNLQGVQLEENIFNQVHALVLPFILFLKKFG